MDIFTHGVWAGVGSKVLKHHQKKSRFRTWLAIVWGIFPDLFAFGPVFPWIFIMQVLGSLPVLVPKIYELEPSQPDTLLIFRITHSLYNLSHSLFVFALIFGFIWWVWKKPVWEMLAWLMHILIDIPTHSYREFPTPFLWPFSELKVNGFAWSNPKVLLGNYIFLIAVYLFFHFQKKKKRRA